MNSGDIAFSHLGIHLTNLPKSISIGNFTIAFYGLIIGIAIAVGFSLAAKFADKKGLGGDVIWDFSIPAVFFSLLGARIYYVICEWENYKDNFISVFNLRQGGIAIYGGVIGAFITIFVFCKIKKINPAFLGDVAVPFLILGQAIGRWGNFFNREVFGEYSDGLFSMQLPIADVRARDITEALASHIGEGQNYISVHPTFLYESVCNLLIFAIIMLLWKHKKFHGEMIFVYFAGYGVARFFIEGIRTDTLFIPGTTVPISQVVAVILVSGSIVGEIVCRILVHKGKIKPYSLSEDMAAYEKRMAELKEKEAAKKGERVSYTISGSKKEAEVQDDAAAPVEATDAAETTEATETQGDAGTPEA